MFTADALWWDTFCGTWQPAEWEMVRTTVYMVGYMSVSVFWPCIGGMCVRWRWFLKDRLVSSKSHSELSLNSVWHWCGNGVLICSGLADGARTCVCACAIETALLCLCGKRLSITSTHTHKIPWRRDKIHCLPTIKKSSSTE